MRKIFLYATVVLVAYLGSCKEENRDPVYLHNSTKEFFSYKDGSTWKYVSDSTPSEIETVTVKDYQGGVTNPGVSPYEFMFYTLENSNGTEVHVRAEAGALNNPIDRITYINYQDTAFAYSPIIWNRGVSFYVNLGAQVTLLKEMEVQSKTYKDVLFVQPAVGDIHREVYIAKGIGVIKKVTKDSTSFSLLEHTVEQ